jgi:transcriptional regulator
VYTPQAFAESDLAALDALVARDPFVSLVTVDAIGQPFVSHLPILYRREGAGVLVEGHWARPNPQAGHAGDALLIVHGPNAYVSPSWYPDKETAARVPTWNYAVAHLHGTLTPSEDPAQLADLVARLSAHFEPTVRRAWAFDAQRPELASQLRGIVAFRFVPARIEMKFKLSQNHPPANVEAAAAALDELGSEDRRTVAALMRERLARRPKRED